MGAAKFVLSLSVAALLVVACVFALGINQGFAKQCPKGLVAASWYGLESCHPGRRCQTATGARFNGRNWIVAHKTFPMWTRLQLTYNGRSVVVPVGDRGPYVRGRVLDLSAAVARALGTKGAGVACIGMKRL